jgi:hypothetical protein
MADEPQDGNAAIDEMGKEPSLDLFFDRNPRTLADADLMQLIEIERKNRALFIEKKGK